MASHGITGRRLTVLIALDDAARAEHLSTALAASGDLLPIVAGSSNSADRADVAIVDDVYLEGGGLAGGANDAAIPRVLLSQRASRQRPADTVFAVLPAAADDLLIAAAARLAAAGYRISGEGRRLSDRHDDFAFHDDDLSDEEPVDGSAGRPALPSTGS
ncbi:helix-turn-helix transcriptional regulator, partial [Mesorhizobium sp.]|uniref:helix-turn-helix transcriptional regulator n=1 Tax=Mesorhizobium sp. TaxID=1871066 RepID=UPI0025E9735F